MAIAEFHFSPLPGETNKAPVGGCWIAGDPPSVQSLPSWDATQGAGLGPFSWGKPATYYPAGYWLPAGTTEYAVLYSHTNFDRNVVYVPSQYQSSANRATEDIQRANAERVPRLLAEGVLTRDEVPEYIRTRGVPISWLRRQERAIIPGLHVGEVYIGRPVQVIHKVGDTARQRRTNTEEIWDEIETALNEGS